jgi:hypothetical protein
MEHFANFGVVKQANKQLKRLQDLKGGNIGQQAAHLLSPTITEGEQNRILQSIPMSLNSLRRNKRYASSGDSLGSYKYPEMYEGMKHKGQDFFRGMDRLEENKRKVFRNPRGDEKYARARQSELIPDKESFNSIRKTDDRAASPTGYLGFRTDPYKGFGGMMEEPVDMISTGIKEPKARVPY